MRSSNWKLLMAPLGILFLFACSPNQYQQLTEYDDVYFTSADRQQAPKVVAKPVEVVPAANAQVISLENTSVRNVEPSLVDKYSSPTQEVTYFEQTEPKVSRASELNYDHFVSDYENSLLKYYELPIDWEENWSEASFDRLVRDDFYFAQAWYEQYYQGDSQRMDEYLNGNQGRLNNTISDFRTRVNFNLGWGWGLNMNNTFVGIGFGNPWAFNDPWMFGNPFAFNNSWRFNRFDPFFYDPYFDPWVSWGGIGWNRNRRLWRRGFNRWNNWGYNPVFINNYYGASRGEIIAARTGRVATRGARLNSTSVTSVRSDALNGSVANRRSGRVASTSNSRITRSSVANVSSARGSSTSRSGTSSVRSSRSSVPNVSTSRSSRVRTDAYRFSDAQSTSRSSRSSSVSSGRTSSSGAVSSRDVRNRSSRFTRAAVSSSRSSGSSSRNSGLSFNRNSSSRSSSNVRTNRTSSRSSSSFSRGSSSRSSSSRSIGSSRSSSSRSSGGSVRSSSSSRSSGSSRSSSGSRSSGSSRSGRGN